MERHPSEIPTGHDLAGKIFGTLQSDGEHPGTVTVDLPNASFVLDPSSVQTVAGTRVSAQLSLNGVLVGPEGATPGRITFEATNNPANLEFTPDPPVVQP